MIFVPLDGKTLCKYRVQNKEFHQNQKGYIVSGWQYNQKGYIVILSVAVDGLKKLCQKEENLKHYF